MGINAVKKRAVDM